LLSRPSNTPNTSSATNLQRFLVSLVVMITVSHTVGRGSIPRRGIHPFRCRKNLFSFFFNFSVVTRSFFFLLPPTFAVCYKSFLLLTFFISSDSKQELSTSPLFASFDLSFKHHCKSSARLRSRSLPCSAVPALQPPTTP
jgi:hypothetical protein